jgi:hypothetical protein
VTTARTEELTFTKDFDFRGLDGNDRRTQTRKKPPEGGLVYQGGVKEDPAKNIGGPEQSERTVQGQPKAWALKYG